MTLKANVLLIDFLLIAMVLSCGKSEDTMSRNATDAPKEYHTMAQTIQPEEFTFAAMTKRPDEMYLYNPTVQIMEYYIQTQKKVIDYLASFRNEFQRYVVKTQMMFCPYETLCNFTVDADTDKHSCCKPCLCNRCQSEKACCPSVMDENEFFVTTMNSTKHIQTSNNTWHFEEDEGKVMPMCTLQHLTLRPLYEQKGFLAISNCPRGTDPQLTYNCSRPYTKYLRLGSVLPVFSNASLETFRNKFCAFCNGITEENLVYFHPIFSCSENTDILRSITSEKDSMDLVFAKEECDITFLNFDTRVHLRECKYYISQCNFTGNWTEYDVHLEIACNAYRSLFSHEYYLFRNVFCAMCNGMSPHTVTCGGNYGLTTYIFSFSGLLKLDFDQGFSTSRLEVEDTVHESSCNENQIVDILTNRCKDLFCPEMRRLWNGNCVNIYESMVAHYRYVLHIRMKPLTLLTIGDAFGNQSNWLTLIHDMFHAKYPDLTLCDAQVAFKANKHFDQSTPDELLESALLYADARICLLKGNNPKPWTSADHLLRFHGTSFHIVRERNKSTEFVLYVLDKDDRLFKIIDQMFRLGNLHNDIMRSSNSNERINILSKHAVTDTDGLTLLPYSILYPINQDCVTASSEINVIRFSSCPKVNISKQDIPWTQTVNGLTINGLKVQSNEYYFADHIHIMTCVETFKKIVKHLQPKRTMNAETVVSIVCCSSSILALLITLIVYCTFPKLRTPLPGKNNMSLAAALMIAQVMFLVGSLAPFDQYSLSCKMMGLSIHFSWLYAIFWMNVCTYHMFRVLSQTKKLVVGKGWKRIIVYHIYVITASFVFVLANVISSIFTSGNIGYGGKFCYIISGEKIIFTFGFPTFLVVFANISMFLIVVIKIKRSSNVRKYVKNDRNDIIIFAKLSTITGIVWVFGFLYAWTSVQVFSYIFIVLNAGQGVFILLAFVVNRQVLLLFQEYRNTGDVTVSSKL